MAAPYFDLGAGLGALGGVGLKVFFGAGAGAEADTTFVPQLGQNFVVVSSMCPQWVQNGIFLVLLFERIR